MPSNAPQSRIWSIAAATAFALALTACKPPAPPPPAAQAMPVAVQQIALSAVPISETFVSTIKSRRTSTMQPQVDGNITKIYVVSGQAVKAGQLLMQIDPLKQVAAVQTQQGLEQQQKALYDYNKLDVERQRQLFEAGVISKQAYQIAIQSAQNAQGAYQSASAGTGTQKEQLAYYQIRAPFAGIIGDIPVHQGDYVSPTTILTTLDENQELEAYIYLPTEHAAEVHNGLPVDLLDTAGNVLVHSSIYFVSPQVDNSLQSILAKAPIPSNSKLRNLQIVNARVTWSTAQTATVPVLAVTRIGGQFFVYVATPRGGGFFAHQTLVSLGEAVGNSYPVLSGVKPGDRIIVSGIQMLGEGAPVMPLPPGPPAEAHAPNPGA